METIDNSEALIQTLTSKGWCFKDIEEIKTTIMIQSAILGDTCSVDVLQSVLANMDLRSIGAKSLPDSPLLRKSSHLVGPKVLQISSVRDISRSNIENCLGNSHSKRLLKLNLTDGHSEVTAVEYSHIPSIPDDVVPGTKVCLQSKTRIYNGIVCLNAKVITVIGGVVPVLYEEWQMNRKYSTLARSTLKLSKENGDDGPPPFEKFQVARSSHKLSQQDYSGPDSLITRPTIGAQMPKLQSNRLKDSADDMKKVSVSDKNKDKPSTSEARPKEVVDNIPLQNQAAAQKLLQKMAVPNSNDRQYRGRKHKGKGREEDDPSTMTLAEWEQRKAGSKSMLGTNNQEVDVPNSNDRQYRGRKHKGKGREEDDPSTMTLAEWEQRKAGSKSMLGTNNQEVEFKSGWKGKQELPPLNPMEWGNRNSKPDTSVNHVSISRDEELAWQLQNQFDLGNQFTEVEKGPRPSNVENIKTSMFNFERNGDRDHGAGHYRGRGSRGGGRGRGRGRRGRRGFD